MSDLLVAGSAAAADGLLVRVTPEAAGWSYVGFEVYRLRRGRQFERPTGDREACAVVLSGRADFSFGGLEWPEVGGRNSVFDGPPYSVYAPPGGVLSATGAAEVSAIAFCWAPAAEGFEPALITPGRRQGFQARVR